MQKEVREKLVNVLLSFALKLEPLAPPAISFYISRRLDELKTRGMLLDYKTNTKRLGRFHYKIEVDLDLTPRQVDNVIDGMLPEQFKRLRR